jgi:dimethylhistidine N-methyltransferase
MPSAKERFEILTAESSGPRELSEADDFARAVSEGLRSHPKSLPCRFFYDAEGSRLFEEICRQPEYYVTRAEREILARHAAAIAELEQGDLDLVELGSGTAEKTEVLLRALSERESNLRYVPVDICREVLVESADRLLDRFDDLSILAVEGEYRPGLRILAEHAPGRKLVLWLGSNVGNFDRPRAAAFLRELARELSPGDHLMLGVDLRKEKAVLEAAYDDAAGITARFNLNLLDRIDRELGGEFHQARFAHRAVYDEQEGRVDMYLESLADQGVRIGELSLRIEFMQGERIHTESSHKYSLEEIDELARAGGFEVIGRWMDSGERFSLNLLVPGSAE